MKNKKVKKTSHEDNYNHLAQSGRGSKVVIKKSQFIASAYKITKVEEKTDILERVKKEMKKASHNAWALRCETPTGIWEDSSDDGEVSGCAGKPIMTILQHLQVVNILVIVTRYYGGINLGPAGLIKAYSSTAKQLVETIGFEIKRNSTS